MNQAFAKYLWWSIRRSSLIFVALLTLTVLLWSKPLSSAVVIEGRGTLGLPEVIMFFFGLCIAAVLFHESSRVGVWLNSRGLTRQSMFVTRCTVGLMILATATALIGILMALGIRQFVQQQLGSPYFPMVRWYELRILPDMFMSACLPFFMAVAFILATRSRFTSYGWYAMAVVSAGMATLPVVVCAPAHRLIVMLFFWLVPALCYLLASRLAPENELLG